VRLPGSRDRWVLVTDGGGGGGRDCISAVRALAAGGYRPAVTVSGRPGVLRISRFAQRRVLTPSAADPDFRRVVKEELARGSYVAVVPASEEAAVALGMAPPELGDKVLLNREAERAGIPVPPTRVFDSALELVEAANEIDFPAVVKPATRTFSAFLATDPQDLSRRIEDKGPVVVQPFVGEPMRAVSGIVWDGEMPAAVHERWLRVWPWRCGLASAAETVRADHGLEERLLDLMKSYPRGLFVAQFAGDRLIDLNLRVASSHPLALRAGVNLLSLYCDLVRGVRFGAKRAQPGFFFRWLEGDLRHLARSVRERELSPLAALAALRPRLGAAHSIESLRDPGPMVARMRYAVGRFGMSEEERRSRSAS
jgi:hypothetical protein